jgi:hypothetical protein
MLFDAESGERRSTLPFRNLPGHERRLWVADSTGRRKGDIRESSTVFAALAATGLWPHGRTRIAPVGALMARVSRQAHRPDATEPGKHEPNTPEAERQTPEVNKAVYSSV